MWGRRVRYGIVLLLRLLRLELCMTPETFIGCKYWSIFSHHYELTWTSRLGKKSTTTSHLCWKDIAHWVAEIWVLVDSLVFCVGAVVPQRFITVPGFTFCELSLIMLIFFLTMQISCPRRDRWNIFGRQEVESLQARLENRRLNTCIVFQLGQNLDHICKVIVIFIEWMKRGSDWHLLIW